MKFSLKWNTEERVKNFASLVKTIGRLLCPSTEYINLFKNNVKTSSYIELGTWSIDSKLDRKTTLFAIEGILKSTEFCLQMALQYYSIKMRTIILNEGKNYVQKKFSGQRFEWIEREINKRLGMTGYKIYEDLNKSEKMFNPFYGDTKEIKQEYENNTENYKNNQGSDEDSSDTEDDSDEEGHKESRKAHKMKKELKKEKIEPVPDESSESFSEEQPTNNDPTIKQEIKEEPIDTGKRSESDEIEDSDSDSDGSDNEEEHNNKKRNDNKSIKKEINQKIRDPESDVNTEPKVQKENLPKSRKRKLSNFNKIDEPKKKKPQQTLLTQFFGKNIKTEENNR